MLLLQRIQIDNERLMKQDSVRHSMTTMSWLCVGYLLVRDKCDRRKSRTFSSQYSYGTVQIEGLYLADAYLTDNLAGLRSPLRSDYTEDHIAGYTGELAVVAVADTAAVVHICQHDLLEAD